jgi:hypothetical protein
VAWNGLLGANMLAAKHAWVPSHKALSSPLSVRAGARLAQRDAQLPEQRRVGLVRARGALRAARLRRGRRRRLHRARRKWQLPRAGRARSAKWGAAARQCGWQQARVEAGWPRMARRGLSILRFSGCQGVSRS